MRKVLYLLTKNPPVGLELLPKNGPSSEVALSVILLQDAVSLTEPLGSSTYVLADHAKERKVQSPFLCISYHEMLEMIFSADSVIAA